MSGDRLRTILAELSVPGAPAARLCDVSTRLIGVSGTGIMLMSGDVPQGSLCSTNEASALIEDLQYTLGEGPSVDAYRYNQVVHEPDLANPAVARWSAFSPLALSAGVRAVFGFPFRMGGARLGAVNLYGGDFHSIAQNAAGMVSVQLGVSVTVALIRLRAYAFSHDRALNDVARDIVSRALRLE